MALGLVYNEMAASDMIPHKICLVEDHILVALKSKEYGHSVTWEDDENRIFRIPWFGEFRPGTRHWKKKHGNFFLDWDRKKGRNVQMTSAYISKSKERIRNALRKSPKVRELKKIGIYKRYQLIQFGAETPLELRSSSPPEEEFDLQYQVESPKSVNSDCRASESGYDSGSPSPGSNIQCFDQVPGDADQIPQIPNESYSEVCSAGQLVNYQIMVVNIDSMLNPITFEACSNNSFQVFPEQPMSDTSECNVDQAQITEMSVSSEKESVTATNVFTEEISPELSECNRVETSVSNELPSCQNIGGGNLKSSAPLFTDNQEMDGEHSPTNLNELRNMELDMDWESIMTEVDKELPDLSVLYGENLLPEHGSSSNKTKFDTFGEDII